MMQKEWGLIALENGLLNGGQISEQTISGKRVLCVACPGNKEQYEYQPEEIIGIKLVSEQEIIDIYPKIIELNKKIG